VFDVGAPKVGLFCPNIFKVVSFRIPAHSAAKYKKNVVKYPPVFTVYEMQHHRKY
jgi:hypothetical protein